MGFRLDRVETARAVLIAGPTASGKTALAMRIAEGLERAGREPVIVNADSMQVYRELRILTARPSPKEESRFAHRLFGTVPAAERYSVARWREDIAQVLNDMRPRDGVPVVVGGTGLYFRVLTQGLSAVPAIPADIRAHWAEELGRLGSDRLHQMLQQRDARSADAVRSSDPQRLLRALEVIDATGRSLQDWQQETIPPLIAPAHSVRLVIDPDRAWLASRIAERFDGMLTAGAIEEARALQDLQLPPSLPACKAIGVRELGAFLRGELSLPEAAERAKAESRRYAKRQRTWFRNQMPDWETVVI